MKTEKKVFCIGGILILGLTLAYFLYGVTQGICYLDEMCYPAIVIFLGLNAGLGFLFASFEGEKNG